MSLQNILEYIDVDYDKEYLKNTFDSLINSEFKSYANCGTISKIIQNTPKLENIADQILTHHKTVFPKSTWDPFATGFNFAETLDGNVPPHCDWGNGNYYNLLLPVFGAARITVYKTDNSNVVNRWKNRDKLEQWYDPAGANHHWSMKLTPDTKLERLGQLVIDKPALLDTNYLHSVKIVDAPRLNWVSRWMDLSTTMSFAECKQIIEEKL